MATFYQCLRGDSSELHIRATGIMDSKLSEAEAAAEDISGKKKSKFKSFKKFFVKKKRKETIPSLVKSGLKPSQSTSDVTTESMQMEDDSEDESGSHTGILGSRALSHDSIFIPDIVQEPTRPGRVFSQENVSDRIKSLQLKLQQNLVMGPPPLRIPSKRMDDAGTSSEDDGLPRSPPEIFLLQEVIHPSTTSRFSDSYKRLSSLSLAGTGSEEEEQISSGSSSRPLSPVSQPLPSLASTRTVSAQRSDSHISPSANFDSAPQFSTCLDSSAAKHRLSVKPRNQRMSKTRKPSVMSSSESLDELSCTIEEDEGDKEEAREAQVQENIGSVQRAIEDITQTVSNMPGTHNLGMPQISTHSSRDVEVILCVAAGEKATSNDVRGVNLEEPYGEQNEPSGAVPLESEERMHSLRLDLDENARGGKGPSKAHGIFSENMHEGPVRTMKPERKPLPHVSSMSDSSPTTDTSGTHSFISSVTESTVVNAKALVEALHVEDVRTARQSPEAMSDFGRQLPRRSSRNHSVHSLHANKAPSPITQPKSPSSPRVDPTYHPPEKSKSDQAPASPNKEGGLPTSHSGNVSEKKVNVPNEPITLRKFSVSSARERPRTGSFNTKGNPDRESQLSVKFTLSKLNPSVSQTEKDKRDAEPVLEQQERKPCTKKQEALLNTEPRPEEKVGPVCVSQIQSKVAALNDSLVISQSPSDSEDKSPFQVKLRSTSFSLRYRGASSPEPKGAKRYSAEFKVEKEASTSVLKEDHTQIKNADGSVRSILNENGKLKAKSSESLNAKPPLPRKPALQTKTGSLSNASIENKENITKPTESKPESKEAEKRPSFHKFSEKGMLSPVMTESTKVTDSQSEPTWITLAKQKQWGLPEQPLSIDEKLTAQEVKVEPGLQEKNKESVEVALKTPADATLNKTSSSASKDIPEESRQETKNDLKEPRPRAHTLPRPVLSTQSALLAEKEEKAQPLRANPAGADRPSWMDLAKKKSQAWNDMPQIIK